MLKYLEKKDKIMKKCRKCKQEKPTTLEYFGLDNSRKDKLNIYCIPCKKEKEAAHRKTEKAKLTSKLYYQNNKKTIKANQKQYNQTEEGKESRKKINARYLQTEHGKMVSRLKSQKRRAILKENGSENFSYEDLRIFWLGQNILDDRCYYCQKSLPDGPEHIDHYIPISQGGGHYKHNLRPSCAECNIRKSGKDPIEFMKEIK
jgi:5-methylcytosine-specific restriction endonuclease McrA